MVTLRTRTDVWMCLFDLKRTVRYYEALAVRYHHRHSLTLLFLAGGVGGSLTTALTDLIPTDLVPAVQSIAAALTAVVTAWVFIADYAAKAAVANMIHYQCVEVEVDLSNLWAAVEDPSNADEVEVRRKFRALQTRLNTVTSRAGNAKLRIDQKLNEQCEVVAKKIMVDEYAH